MPDDTAVLLHGDHGFHLGEYAQWKKNTNWEECVKTPLIVKVPWMDGIAGTHSSALAELIDVMPTLADLAGMRQCGTVQACTSLHPTVPYAMLYIAPHFTSSSFSQLTHYPCRVWVCVPGIPLPSEQLGDKLFPVEGSSLVPALTGGCNTHRHTYYT